MTDKIRTAVDAPRTLPSPGHFSMWRCDKCKAESGIFSGRKRYRGGWVHAGCLPVRGHGLPSPKCEAAGKVESVGQRTEQQEVSL